MHQRSHRVEAVRTRTERALCGLPLLALVVFDVTRTDSAAQRFIWLFCYDYVNDPRGRVWPTALQFGVPLLVFAGLLAFFVLLLGARRTLRGGVLGLCVAAVAFTYFSFGTYFPVSFTVMLKSG